MILVMTCTSSPFLFFIRSKFIYEEGPKSSVTGFKFQKAKNGVYTE